jgi:hypothetical protein
MSDLAKQDRRTLGLAAAGIGIAALAGLAAPASAQLSPQGTGNCKVGGTVATRDGKVGVVDTAEGNSCYVKFPDGTREYKLQWMLTPAKAGGTGGRAPGAGSSAAAKSGGAVQAGNYQCYGGQAGNMRITLKGNRWNDFYAERLPDGRVGISSRPNGRPYYMVCERR